MAGETAATARTPALFAVGSDEDAGEQTGRRRTLRHERALNAAIRARNLDAQPAMSGAVTLARALAAQLDIAERKGDSYATSQLARPFRDLLADLGLITTAGDDDGEAALGGLGETAVGDSTE